VDYDSRSVSLGISGKGQFEIHSLRKVRTKGNLDLPMQTVDMDKLPQNWNHLKTVDLESLQNAKPTILIGGDNCELISSRRFIRGARRTPLLSKTALGWVIHGNPSDLQIPNSTGRVMCTFPTTDEKIRGMMKEYFRIESIGMQIPQKKLMSKDDSRAIELTDKTTHQVGNG